MQRVDGLLGKLGNAKFMTKLDLTKGHQQIPIRPEDVPLTGFVTPHGRFAWRYMAFGLSGAPSSFCKLSRKLFEGLDDFCAAYLDDISIFITSWELHLEHLTVVLERIAHAHLTLNLRKCVFAMRNWIFWGIISL